MIIVYISVLIMRLRMQSAINTANTVRRVSEDLLDQGALNAVSAAWAQAGSTCSPSRRRLRESESFTEFLPYFHRPRP